MSGVLGYFVHNGTVSDSTPLGDVFIVLGHRTWLQSNFIGCSTHGPASTGPTHSWGHVVSGSIHGLLLVTPLLVGLTYRYTEFTFCWSHLEWLTVLALTGLISPTAPPYDWDNSWIPSSIKLTPSFIIPTISSQQWAVYRETAIIGEAAQDKVHHFPRFLTFSDILGMDAPNLPLCFMVFAAVN